MRMADPAVFLLEQGFPAGDTLRKGVNSITGEMVAVREVHLADLYNVEKLQLLVDQASSDSPHICPFRGCYLDLRQRHLLIVMDWMDGDPSVKSYATSRDYSNLLRSS